MEAKQNITMEPYNIEYYIAKYGTVENLTKDYIGAIDGLRLQYRQYETNPCKGGRYRREKMEHIRQQAEAIYDELLRVSRAMKDYFAAQPTETPRISTQASKAVNVSAEGEKEAERAENKPYYTHRWRVLHNCDLKTWDKFHKKHKEAILIFHHETTYTALQKEAVKVSEMCDIACEVNRHGVEVCLFNDVTLTQIIEQGIYVAIAELPKVPDYGLTDAPQSPEIPQTVECATDAPKPRENAAWREINI